jgi:hypothetical protein
MNPTATTIPEQTHSAQTRRTEQTRGTEANPAQTLPGLLRAHAAGLLADLAAVDLLIAHRYWLTRPGFTARFVHPVTAPDGHADGHRIGAWIDWQAAITALQHRQLPCSGSEADMLRIAASLATGTPVILREVLGGLDHANIAAVTSAITAANGTH